MRLTFEQAERLEKDGVAAYRAGDTPTARAHLLKAAELLLLSAKEAPDDLKQARLEKARKLRELAAKLPAKGGDGPAAALPAAGGGDDKDGEQTEFAAMDKPDIRFADVAGLEDVKEQIRLKMILPFLHPEQAAAYRVRRGGGILLYGPPGTGKTLIARATAGELDAAFFSVRPSQILSKWVGDAERNIAELFATARAQPKAVVFIDELDALVPARGAETSPVMQRVVPQILTELEGVDSADRRPVLFLGATNTPWTLDPAVLRPGRFDALVYIGLPDAVTRQKILELQLADRPLEPGFDPATLVEATEGRSGADLRALVERVAGAAFRQAIESGDIEPITRAAFEAALAHSNPSVRPEQLVAYERFRTERASA